MDEIRKFRSLLASVAKVQLDTKPTLHKLNATVNKSVLTETTENCQAKSKRSFSPVPESFITTQWEEEMLHKYQDLFQFPLDKTINDRTMILLVLAYQMNTLRCWCEVNEGALAKVCGFIYLIFFLNAVNSLLFFFKKKSMYLILWKNPATLLTGVNNWKTSIQPLQRNN